MVSAPCTVSVYRPIRRGVQATAAYVGESRPAVQAMFLLRFAATSALLRHPSLDSVLAGVGWVLTTASFYVLNGISDVFGDRANGSTRPLASGRLRRRTAWRLATISGGAGVVICFRVDVLCGALAAGLAALGVAYSVGPRLKAHALTAALTIGAGAGLTYLGGWAIRGPITLGQVAFAAALSAWVAAACSTKDFSDVEGDRLAGRRTLPAVFGLACASWIVSGASLAAALAVVAAAVVAHTAFLAVGLLALGAAALPVACRKARRGKNRDRRRLAYRVYMLTQYAVNGAMVLVGVAA